MKTLKTMFQIFLAGFGLFSMVALGANGFYRWADRESCIRISPLAEFVEYNYWDWDCLLLPLVDGTYVNVSKGE